MVIWITGLSGAGKTTLAAALYGAMKPRLSALGYPRSGNRMNLLQTYAVCGLVESLNWQK